MFEHYLIGDRFCTRVPQGRVLEPLLFVIFINNLPHCFRSATPYLYADDTKCIKSIHNSTETTLTVFLTGAVLEG